MRALREVTGIEDGFLMPKEMELAAPMLRISDLDDSLVFYKGTLGLREKGRHRDSDDGLEVYELGAATSRDAVLLLKHDPLARPARRDFAGLYHYAILVPTRKSLASTYLAIGNTGMDYDGFADHHVSEALYLHDVELNGIEVYADRSPETWAAFRIAAGEPGAAAMRRFMSLNKPLDLNSLLGELNRAERAEPSSFPAGARIGHMHLRVTDLDRSVKFYHETLGLDVVAHLPEVGAAFLSVGGYHHHIGLNTWHSANGTPHRRGDLGLDSFTMVLPDGDSVDRLTARLHPSSRRAMAGGTSAIDPDGIEIRLVAKQD